MKRIDSLKPNTPVLLKFTHGTEEATFLALVGEGDSRRARFIQCSETPGELFEWEAYRYQGHWTYGTSAERLSLVAILD